MRILVTAFEPYGGNDTNISQRVLDATQADVAKLLLPVSFRRAPEVLNEAIGQLQPDVIIAMGQAAEGDKIRLERLAINLMDSAKGDNDGYIPDEELICPEAPLALKTALPVKQLCADCINAGLPTIISNSAGSYVCNRVYWEALHYTEKALFVHIPKNMDIETVRNTIMFLIKQLSNSRFTFKIVICKRSTQKDKKGLCKYPKKAVILHTKNYTYYD